MFKLDFYQLAISPIPILKVWHPDGNGMGVIAVLEKADSNTVSGNWDIQTIPTPEIVNVGAIYSTEISAVYDDYCLSSFSSIAGDESFINESIWINENLYLASYKIALPSELEAAITIDFDVYTQEYLYPLIPNFNASSVYYNTTKLQNNNSRTSGTWEEDSSYIRVYAPFGTAEYQIHITGDIVNNVWAKKYNYYQFDLDGFIDIQVFEYLGETYRKILTVEAIADKTFIYNKNTKLLTIFTEKELPVSLPQRLTPDRENSLLGAVECQ